MERIFKQKRKSFGFLKFESSEAKRRFEEKFAGDSLKIKNKKVKVRDVRRVPSFMKKPKRDFERKKGQSRRKKKRNPHLENAADIYERIAPLEKFAYPRQLEIKQTSVLEWTRKFQRRARAAFKMDPQLIRQAWLKPGADLCAQVRGIEFKCAHPETRREVARALERRKELAVQALASGDKVKAGGSGAGAVGPEPGKAEEGGEDGAGAKEGEG